MNDQPHIVTEENARKIAHWLKSRGGIAIWNSIDLSDPGQSFTTPVLNVDGTPVTKPHWKCEGKPSRIIISPTEVVVSKDVELTRFHVAVRMGSNGLKLKLTDASSRKLRAAVAKAGTGAYHVFDYGDYKNAVIMKPAEMLPLTEWLDKNPEPEGAQANG